MTNNPMSEEKITKNYINKLVKLAEELKTAYERPIVTTEDRAEMESQIKENEITSKLMYLVGFIEALGEQQNEK